MHTDQADLGARLAAALTGRYAVERELGQGGTAIVFLAQDLRHSRPVAIKVLRPELSAVVGSDRFLQEIEIAARLQHPHILAVYDSGEADGLLYYVMPYVAGESLRTRLDREKQLPLADTIALTREIASALGFAHSQGVIHRDIKPENILLFGGSAVVADFGIARALRAAGGGRMTEVGMALGTPLYMSPEQAAGASDTDARSDIYSLGCVVYEMLAGTAPFGGINPIDVMTHHIHQVPRPLQQLRGSVPHPVAVAVARALAKLPADRFSTVHEFSVALGGAIPTPTGDFAAEPRWRWGRMGIVAAMAMVVLTVGAWIVKVRGDGLDLDPALYAVVPFSYAGAPTPGLDGEAIASLMYGSLGRWSDIAVVDMLRSGDAWQVAGVSRGRLERAIRAAGSVGAGKLILGDVVRRGDSIVVHASLYAVGRSRRPEVSERAVLSAAASPLDLSRAFHGLAAAMVAHRPLQSGADAWLGTRTAAAWQSFASGQAALSRWDLAAAVDHFRRAVLADPAFAQAQLYLAQVTSWMNHEDPAWQAAARAALARQAGLSGWKDSAYARALVAIADNQYPAACEAYEGVVARDSADVIAWYGLGECRRLDRQVVRDPRSPSGWRFRSGTHAALAAYRHAMNLAPSMNYVFGSQVYARASRIVFAEPQRYRMGYSTPDSAAFAAFSGLDADTLTFTPYPLDQVLDGRWTPASHEAAVAASRDLLTRIVEDWARAHPGNPDARHAYAIVLERRGELTGDRERPAALQVLREARAAATGHQQRHELAYAEVRILLKLHEFGAARVLAESVVTAPRDTAPARASHLDALAMLIGRPLQADSLYAAIGVPAEAFDPSSGRRVSVAAPAARAAARFYLLSAAGAPPESLRQALDAAEQEITRWTEPGSRAGARNALLAPGLVFAFHALGVVGPPVRGDYLAEAQSGLRQRNSEPARRMLALVTERRRTVRPGDVDAGSSLNEALVALAIGDSAAAVQLLDGPLQNLSAMRVTALDDPGLAAGLVRAMALRAHLAAARSDTATARRWASAVLALWSAAEDVLQPQLVSLRRYVTP